jgi:hypothetical protein
MLSKIFSKTLVQNIQLILSKYLELASGGTVNTFYSYDAISTAKGAGFKLISKEVLL